MRSVSIRLCDMERESLTIPIGFVGENLFTRVNIDCKKHFDEYPNDLVGLVVTPPRGDKYPAIVTRDGDIVVWNVTASDLIYKGSGEIQLTFTDGEHIGKSYKVRTSINDSIEADGDVPEPLANFLAQASLVLEAIPQDIDNALQEAKDSGEFDGADGVGITSIVKTATAGLVDTYTITLDNGVTFPFTVTNGKDGEDGETGDPGHTPVITAEKVGKVTTIYVDGTAVAQINDGQDGSGGGAVIDDTTPAVDKVFSSSKVDQELTDVKNAIHQVGDINKAIVTLFQHTAFTDAEAANAYNALYALVYDEPTPTPYQKVAYVETDGSSRIDTGVLFDGTKNIVVTMEMSFNGTLANNDSILNGWSAGGSMGVSGSQSGKWNEGSYPVEADLGYVDEMTTCVMTINAGTNTNTDYSFTNTHGSREMSRGHTNVANRTYLPFPLFALSKQDSFDFLKSGLRIKSVEIKVGGTVVRSMYACYRKADNVIGFYDETNDVFYTNAGTGSFTKGGDIA